MGLTSAAKAYGTMERGTGEQILGAPRSRFNFQVIINTKNKIYTFERIKSATIPDISYDTQIIDQYNIKRVVQTRTNYGTSTITFYHTYDDDDKSLNNNDNESGNFLTKLIYPYNASYYNNDSGIQAVRPRYSNTVIQEDFNPNLGYTLTNNDERYFIKDVIIRLLGAKSDSTDYRLRNCIITNISGDTLSYSDSQPIEVSVTFQPERIDLLKQGR